MKRIIAGFTGLVFLAYTALTSATGFPFQPNQVLNAADLNTALQTAAITSGTIDSARITNSPISGNTGSFTGLTSPSVSLTGGLIDNIPIGTTTPVAGSFTNLTSNGTVSGTGFSSYLASPPAIGGTTPNTGRFTTATVNIVSAVSATITGGTIDNTVIGSSVPSTGRFTTVTANVVSAVSATITGGTIDNTVIGSSVPAAGTFTTLTATGSINGPGTGLTGTAAALSIGGNAATATTAAGFTGTASQRIPTITATVGSNAMTVGAATQYLDFRSTTLGSGTISTINAAPSALVIPSGATLGTFSGLPNRLMIVEMNNGGTAELAVINNASGNPLDETALISTTAISAGSASANVFYSTTARTNLPFRVVGYVESTQATAGTWATAPSTIQGVQILPEANLAASTYLGIAQATTSGTSIIFTGIPVWAKRITVTFKGVGTSGTSVKQVQIGSGSAATSGYLGTTVRASAGGTASATVTSGFGINSNVATERFEGSLIMSLENSSTNTWVASGTFGETITGIGIFSGGYVSLTGTLDRVIVTTVNGTDTFAAGEVNLMWE